MRHSIFYNLVALMLIVSSCGSQEMREQHNELQTEVDNTHEHKEDLSAILQPIVSYAKAIQYWGYSYNDDNEEIDRYDSLDHYNKKLRTQLINIANTQPEILNADLSLLKDSTDLIIATSPDRKFNIYSWDEETGGTMHNYDYVIQYPITNGTKAFPKQQEEEYDPGVFFGHVHVIKNNVGKTYYLATYTGIYSTNDMGAGVKAFTIENDKLIDAPIFVTPNKTYSNISYNYNYFLSSNLETGEANNYIHLSDDNKKLYIPVVISKDKGDAVTNRSLVYVFDGEKYVFDKNAK